MTSEPVPAKGLTVRFYGELNDFLGKELRQKPFWFSFRGSIGVRQVIESLGVPHTAVDLVLRNGEPAGFTVRVQSGDRLSVYPVFELFDISGLFPDRRKPLRTSRFILDAHLGKLARMLRMVGFDTLFAREESDGEIIERSLAEKRIILTRDRELLKSSRVDHGYYVRATRPREQLAEVAGRFDLVRAFDPFSRCLVCNHRLEEVPLDAVRERLLPDTAALYSRFFSCSGCGRLFWEGSHFKRMMDSIEELRQEIAGQRNRNGLPSGR